MTTDKIAINITRVIDDGPVTRLQIAAIVLCSLVAFLDGVDTQSIAVAAPLIAEKLQLARASLGLIFSAALLGAMIGALTFGPLADRFGRKSMLVFAAVVFGVFTLLTAYVQSYELLLAVRFAAGVGLGGATPCFLALGAEYAPKRRRAMVTTLLWAAFPLGGILGSVINAYILANLNWQTIFLVGGILPFIVALALAAWLPELIRFLLASGDHTDRLDAIMRRIRPELPASVRFVADEERIAGAPLKHLFSGGRAFSTLLLWVPFFTAFGILGIDLLWAPVLLRENGIAPAQAAIAIGGINIGSLIGVATAGRLMERFGTVTILVPALILGGIATGTLGYAATSVAAMSVAMGLAGLFVGMGAAGSIALAALTYPTAIRSTGIGLAMGIGRFGQVVAPLFAAIMVAASVSGVQLFLILAFAPVIGALAIAALVWNSRATQQAAAVISPSILP